METDRHHVNGYTRGIHTGKTDAEELEPQTNKHNMPVQKATYKLNQPLRLPRSLTPDPFPKLPHA